MIMTDIVYSPDDGGWYADQTDLDQARSRVTRRIYPTKEAVETALRAARPEKCVWEKWH